MMLDTESSAASEQQARRSAAYYQTGFWRPGDLWSSISAVAHRDPGRVALICDDRTIGYAELISSSARIGSALAQRGLRAGDVVVIHARNSIESVQALLACAYVGAVITPIPPMFSRAQVASIIGSAGAKAVIGLGEPKELEQLIHGAREAKSVEAIIVPESFADGIRTLSWSTLHSLATPQPRTPVIPEALALLVYSSGTTGQPKGVMHSANTVRYAIEQRSRLHGVTARDTCLVVSQFGFVGSAVFGLMAGLLNGTTSVLLRGWDPDRAIRAIEKYRVSYAHFMPTHTHDVLSSATLDHADVSSFYRGALGGLTAERRLEARARLCPRPLPSYGMSECLGNSTCALEDRLQRILASDGRPFPGTELVVLTEQGEPAQANEVGALHVRGPSRFLGYFGAPELTREALTPDGFFRTGDFGSLDEDGYLTFASRAKDIIRRGGVTIFPAEVEAILMTHPDIAHIAIVGTPDERLGERACACIIPKGDRPVTLEAVTHFLQIRGVARYLWPERAAMFETFPRTPSLKVQKRALIEELRQRDTAG